MLKMQWKNEFCAYGVKTRNNFTIKMCVKLKSASILMSFVVFVFNLNLIVCAEDEEVSDGENDIDIDPEIFKEFENKMRLQEALGETPLAKNPFFIRTMGDPVFTGNGTEGAEPDFSGYTCRFIGTLNCSDDFVKQCTGAGVIDCLGSCPGDEATFSKMGDMIESPELAKEFPVIAYINKLRENKTEEEKEKGNKYLVALLTECGFEKMLALLDLRNSGFGDQDSTDPNAITYVDKDATVGFGDYDYDDYYDDEEEEETEPEPEDDTVSEPESEPESHIDESESSKDPQSRTLPLDKMDGSGGTETKLENGIKGVNDPSGEVMEKATTRKEDVPIDVNKRQAEENEDVIHKMQNRWPKRNVPRSVVEQHEPNGYKINELDKSSSVDEVEKNTIASKRNRRHVAHSRDSTMSNKTIYKVRRRPPSKKAILTRLQSEVQAFKQTFLRAVDIVEQMGHTMDSLELMENSMWNESNLWQNETRRRRHAIYPLKEEREAPLVRKLADQMRTLPLEKVRQIRSVAEELKVGMDKEEKCEVKNLTCVTFPTKKQCSGIGVGGCVSRTQLLAMFFSPRVVYFIVITIIFCIAGGIGIAVYVFKRRSNEVAPDAGDGVNQGGSESDRDKQGDCQRAKQVPMNPPAGT